MYKPDFIGWVRITSSDSMLSQCSYDLLKSNRVYRVSYAPNGTNEFSKRYLRVFMEDLSFYVVYESHFIELSEGECIAHEREITINNILDTQL